MTKVVIYADESCHLEHDREKAMVLGCIWVPRSEVSRLSAEMRDIKTRHKAAGELKWTKVSNARSDFYQEMVAWFFNQEPLHFRAVVVSKKQELDHARFNKGSHDTFYYKMQFTLLNKILSPTDAYEIYFDIKDTRSKFKIQHLGKILLNNAYDFTGEMIDRLQHVRSHEVELLQLADLLIGAVSYKHRGLSGNSAKLAVVDAIEHRTGRSLIHSTPLTDQKFNLFVWDPNWDKQRGNS